MRQYDLGIVNVRVVSPNGVLSGGVGVRDGKIQYVGSSAGLDDADKVISGENNYLVPGFIDPHNHMGVSGGPERDGYHPEFESDMETETRAAIHGGTTTLLTFLLQKAAYSPDMEWFVNTGEEQSYTDFKYHAIIHKDHHFQEMERLAEEWGINSYKLFFNMYKKTAPEFGIDHANAADVYKVLKKSANINNSVVMFHAENDDVATTRQEELKEKGKDGLSAWADSSPGICQAMQIEQIGMLTEYTGATSYVVHNSMKETLASLERYQERGVDLHGEVLGSFLANHCEEDIGAWGKISPPVGYPEDQKALWQGLRKGTFQHAGTDHCPYDLEDKGERDVSIWEPTPGDVGLETFLPVLMSEGVNKNRLSIERAVEVASTNNAKMFGMYPQKGVIQEGSDADLVLVDLDKSQKVEDDFYHGREPRYSSLHGKELTGLPTHVIKGGEVIVKDDELIADKGIGDYLS